ncbi:hypothetical protein H6A18_04585 [Collinsella tanakaei]|uniref:hypothetical protein n=1 Tax=Collinsella tanakaei TaxID=626935 RepID=UPI00195E8AE2|nr:hypothetical protein [Collinsella tanakaei]MBM6755796.1 hypothetical protein [Collinsella tanakaei]MBM6868612.1 hypothetical protein [Collinsella tanakaei]
MSQNQKMLKIMSFVELFMAVAMAAWTGMSFMFANTSPGLLLSICSLVCALLDLYLGVWGIGVANRPSRGLGIYYVGITWLAVVLSAVSVVVYVFIGGLAIPAIANLAVAAVYLYCARRVRFEELR